MQHDFKGSQPGPKDSDYSATTDQSASICEIERRVSADPEKCSCQGNEAGSGERLAAFRVHSYGPGCSFHEDVPYPEGGLEAWLVVMGSFSGMMAAFGLMNTIGVFHAHLSEHQLKDYNDSTIGWIFSIYVFLSFFCGLQIGPVFDAYGPRLLILGGSILLVLSMVLLGFCTQYYQFILAFGVIGGIGTSLIFTPSVSAISHYFFLKRGGATGLAAAGGSIGGMIFPLMLQSLIPKLGFAWATRILALILLVLCVIANIFIRSRLPPDKKQSVLPDFRIFRNHSFSFATAAVFTMEWGLFIPITYLSSFVMSGEALPAKFGYQLLAIFNAGSSLGRWLPGIFADRIGRFNAMIITLMLCAVTTLSLWLPASLLAPPGVAKEDLSVSASVIQALVILYALLFGFASGSNISLTPVCIGQLCDTEEYGRYYATCYTIVAFGTLTGIPIAGVLLSVCGDGYWGLVGFTGATYVASVILFTLARGKMVGWSWKKY